MLGKTQVTDLECGVRVVTSQMDNVESFCVAFDAPTGGRMEKTREAGFSHFLEHMLFKGSAKRPSTKAISQPLEERGGQFNAYTGIDHTCFFALVPADSANLAVDILGDMYAAPVLSQTELERERGVVLSEIEMYFDDPSSHASDMAMEALWPKHPLGAPILGTPKSLAGANHETLELFHRTHYTAPGTIVAAAGKLDHKQFVDEVEKRVLRLPGLRKPKVKPAASALPIIQLFTDERETQQVQAVVSCRTFGHGSECHSAMTLLSTILGGGLTSRLFMTVRERHGLCYSIGSSHQTFSDTGMFSISAGLDAKKAAKAMSLISSELRKIVAAPVGKAELERAKRSIIGAQRISGETSYQQMSWILTKMRSLQRVETPEEVIARINAVTREEIQALAAELFKPENLSLVLVMPRGNPDKPETIRAALDG